MLPRLLCSLAAFFSLFASMAAVHKTTPGVPAERALKELLDGNKRYVAAKLRHPHQGVPRRVSIARGQHPIAVVIGCGDSRVPPELVFDQGLGDLFVLRIVGHIVDDAILGSIEYAVEHLGAGLVVVLGHERCGGVDAAVKGGDTPGHLSALIAAIAPAVESVRGKPGDLLDNAVRANVGRVAQQLRSAEPILAARVKAGKLRVVGTRYDLDTGVVELLR
jgi:carbonic anhydrase